MIKWLGIIGSIASIIGLLLFFWPSNTDPGSGNSNTFKDSDNNQVTQQLEANENTGPISNTNAFNNSSGNVVDQSVNIYENQTVPVDRRFEDKDFDRHLNGRFGFGISYPKTWRKTTPVNGDGVTLTNPRDENIQILAWGSLFCMVCGSVEECVCDPFDVPLRTGDWVEVNGDFIVEEKGRDITYKQSINAVRNTTIEDGVKKEAVYTSLLNNGRSIGVSCMAPVEKYADYEDLFLKVISSLHVHKRRAEY